MPVGNDIFQASPFDAFVESPFGARNSAPATPVLVMLYIRPVGTYAPGQFGQDVNRYNRIVNYGIQRGILLHSFIAHYPVKDATDPGGNIHFPLWPDDASEADIALLTRMFTIVEVPRHPTLPDFALFVNAIFGPRAPRAWLAALQLLVAVNEMGEGGFALRGKIETELRWIDDERARLVYGDRLTWLSTAAFELLFLVPELRE